MNNKGKILKIFNCSMFYFVFVFRLLIEVLQEKSDLIKLDNFRYTFIAFAVFCCFIEIILNTNKEKKYFFKKEVILLLIVCGTFLIYSIYLSKKTGVQLNKRTYVELLYLIIPVLYSFCIINTYDFKTIERMIRGLFWVNLVLYLYSINIFSISLKDIAQISFSESRSCFESSIFAFPMLSLFFFFSYYRKYNKKYWISSFILTLMTFKRMIMIWAVFLFVLDVVIELRVYVPKIIKYIFAIAFSIMTVIYYGALINTGIGHKIELLLGIDLDKATMGRKWYLYLLLHNNYNSYGYGSSSVALGKYFQINNVKYLEMDLIKIFLEIGFVCVFVFCLYFWKITHDSLFNIIMMLSIFMNLLVSHSLTDPFDWTIIYIILISVAFNLSNRNDRVQRKKIVFRFR